MKLRTQLVIAFLLLAVLPLAGIVSYSYFTSLRAVRQTVAEEASELAVEMNDRLAAVEGDLQRRIGRFQRLPLLRLLRQSGGDREAVTRRLLGEMGDAAPLVEAFEFLPAPEAPQPPLPPGESSAPFPPTPEAEPGDETARKVEAIVLQVTDEIRHHIEAIEVEEVESLVRLGLRYGQEVEQAVTEALSEQPGEDGEAPEGSPPEVGELVTGADAPSVVQEITLVREGEKELPPEELARLVFRQARAERRKIKALAQRERAAEEARLHWLSKQDLEIPIVDGGATIGRVATRIRAQDLLRQVLLHSRREQGEVPYALDADGELVALDDADKAALTGLPLKEPGVVGDWVIANTTTPAGLTVGIARPIREPLAEVQRTAARNFGYGLGLIGLALIGILPLSRRMTRDLGVVTEGAERIAAGDLATRVPVRSRDEIGQLARAFNDMAHDLERHQERLVEQERLEVEYERKTRELEEAREFQLSLLPKQLPKHPSFELAVHMQTANEVGGDYYDFHLADDGALTLAIGDATGHGARAGTMVTVVKSLFSAYTSKATPGGLSDFLRDASRAIRRMELDRMAMTLTLAELRGTTLTVAAAGMPPVLVSRASTPSEVEEIELQGMPLGGLEFDYGEHRLELASGDVVLLMTDGFPELQRPDGGELGYDATREHFARAADAGADRIVAQLAEAVAAWTEGEPPNDDVTFVVLEIR